MLKWFQKFICKIKKNGYAHWDKIRAEASPEKQTFFSSQHIGASSRPKEIGIRKVNGAQIWEVMAMLNKDFVKWVTVAFVIATPIAWYAMHKWLENSAYKTELSWWIFALSGIFALIIALLTVSWQSWKVSTKNPVEVLRDE